MKAGTLLGTGRLNWPASERVSDRYGLVGVWADNGDGVVAPRSLSFGPMGEAHDGELGRLIAVVVQTRESRHIGDLFRGFVPGGAKVGDAVELGTGVLFYSYDPNGEYVGLRPDEGADDTPRDWLDPRALYRVHDQTVELRFVPLAQGVA